jgi:hypothetical protein
MLKQRLEFGLGMGHLPCWRPELGHASVWVSTGPATAPTPCPGAGLPTSDLMPSSSTTVGEAPILCSTAKSLSDLILQRLGFEAVRPRAAGETRSAAVCETRTAGRSPVVSEDDEIWRNRATLFVLKKYFFIIFCFLEYFLNMSSGSYLLPVADGKHMILIRHNPSLFFWFSFC